MAGNIRSVVRTAPVNRAVPRGWMFLGFIGISWAGFILLIQGVMALFQYISASI